MRFGGLKLHNNRLDTVVNALDFDTKKSPVLPQTWVEAKLGYPAALRYVVAHNDADVLALEELFGIMEPYARMQKKSI